MGDTMKNNDELSKRFEDIRKILDIRNLNEIEYNTYILSFTGVLKVYIEDMKNH